MQTTADPVERQTALVLFSLVLICSTAFTSVAAGQELLLGNHLYRAGSTPMEQSPVVSSSPTSEKTNSLACFKPGTPPSHCGYSDPWTLMDYLYPCSEPQVVVGGWQQVGFTTASTGLFNTNPDRCNLHQSWLSATKACDPSQCDFDWGFCVDIMYGTDADDTQSFGNNPGRWDFLNGFDHGSYGWAIPQLYGELAYRELSIMLGHFFTIMGYETVTAPSNFFFSHSYTMYNSEPFTHTGVLTSYQLGENATLHNGWTSGWDTGFDQRDGGSNYLGGMSASLCECCKFTYTTSIGNFGARGRSAYAHSMVLDLEIPGGWNYVVQSDLLRVRSTGEYNVGVNQYLLYTLCDQVKLGSRIEWWKADAETGFTYDGQISAPTSTSSYCAATIGVNLRPHENLLLRPEIRHNWAPFADYQQAIFAMDLILTY